MKSSLLMCVLALMFSGIAIGQSLPIGSWKVHLPFGASIYVADADDAVYSATNISIFKFNKEDGSIQLFDKVKGLSDQGIQLIAYHKEKDVLLIAYTNSNIDLLKNGNLIVNLPDIRDDNRPGNKRINHVYFENERAYISSGLGILLLNLDDDEFFGPYAIGDAGATEEIWSMTADNQFIYAATSKGIRVASRTSNLAFFANWQLQGSNEQISNSRIDALVNFKDRLYCSVNDSLLSYNSTVWQYFYTDADWENVHLDVSEQNLILTQWQKNGSGEVIDKRFVIFDELLNVVIYNEDYYNLPVMGITDNSGILWIADSYEGLKRQSGTTIDLIKPNGPGSDDVYSIDVANSNVYVAAGGVDGFFNFVFNRSGFYVLENGWWNTFSENTTPALFDFLDILDVAVRPEIGKAYFASFLSGLIEFDNGTITTYDQNNSILENSPVDPSRTKVSSVDYDNESNLWISNYGAANPIAVLRSDGSWHKFNAPLGVNTFKTVFVDSYGQKWFTVKGNGDGLVVFDEGDDFESSSDDRFVRLRSGLGNGSLPNNIVHCVVEDQDGEIWVGTNEGIAVFYCAPFVLDNEGCEAQRIIVERDGFAGYLFETEIVNTIAVDGADRKWIGTTNGVWLISADGLTEILNFTTDNSPLPSNEINSIAIDDKTGEVYIGTDAGLISYISDATKGTETHEDVLVFPNPVPPEYEGPIAIRGLVEDSFVKITDVSGGLIYEAPALGGQAIWNGRSYNGERAKTGVYMVFSSNRDGTEKYVAKILLVN